MNVNPLVLAQSDLVAIYHLPNPDDRERVAKTGARREAQSGSTSARELHRSQRCMLLGGHDPPAQ